MDISHTRKCNISRNVNYRMKRYINSNSNKNNNANSTHFKFHEKIGSYLTPKYHLNAKYTRNFNTLTTEPKTFTKKSVFNIYFNNNSTQKNNINFNSAFKSIKKQKEMSITGYNNKYNTTRTSYKKHKKYFDKNNNTNFQRSADKNDKLKKKKKSNSKIDEIKKKIRDMNNKQIKNYIIYVKDHLNSSYYANNDLNNECNRIKNKSRELNDLINNNNDKYLSMNKLYEKNMENNKNIKEEYLKLVDEYKLNNINEQNKLKELNQILDKQDNDIFVLENENEILKEDLLNKKIIIEKLKEQIGKLKNKKGMMEAYNEYLYLFDKKNKLISVNQIRKNLKKIKEKNEELIKKIDILKNDLKSKENTIIKSKNEQKELSNKLILLEKDNELENKNINTKNNNRYLNTEDDSQNNDDLNNNNNYEHENDSIEYYQKLIEDENIKGKEINEKLNFFKEEINRIQNDIVALKSKNNKEIMIFKNQINNLSPNNEEIKNELISNKEIIKSQQESLIKYNKQFRESLKEKNDLKNKINKLKIENKNIELKLNENHKMIGFKIKSIKIRRGGGIHRGRSGKNNRRLSKERNLSNSDLLKNSKISDKLEINKNMENFIPKRDIYRYKRYEYKYEKSNDINNKTNMFKSRRTGSFDNIFKFNETNAIEQENNIDILSSPRSGTYLYTIDEEGKLLGYSMALKKFVYINTSSIKCWRLFYKEYKKNSNGSLLLNTLAGLFILTGDNYDNLYYYSQSKNTIYLIIKLKYNHMFGGLLSTTDNNKIIIVGGKYTNEVEIFNIKTNTLKSLPSLLTKRINSSYCIFNNYLFVFFGKNNNTIEYLNIKKEKKWKRLEYRSNNYIKELSGHIGFKVNDNVVVIVGGVNNDKIIVFYFKEKFLDVTDFILKFDIDCGIDELYFDKEKYFNIIQNKELKTEIVGMDTYGNVHCFDNDYSYTIFVF